MIEKKLEEIEKSLTSNLETLLECRTKIPITAKDSHGEIRYMEQHLQYAIDRVKNAISSIKRECPTVLEIGHTSVQVMEVSDDQPF